MNFHVDVLLGCCCLTGLQRSRYHVTNTFFRTSTPLRAWGITDAGRERSDRQKVLAGAISTATAVVSAVASALIDASTACILSTCPATALPAGITPPTV